MAPLYSQTSLIAFSVLISVLISHGAGLRFTQQDYESRSHSALLQGIHEFSIENTELFSDVQSTEDLPLDEVTNLKQCSCKGTTCGCCLHAKMKKIGLDADVCLNLSYLPSEIGIQVELTVDKKVVFKKKVSAKNPPAICAGVPGLKKLASVCIRFYDLSVSGKRLSGCVELQARLAKLLVEKVKLGCFKVPPTIEVIGSENSLSEVDDNDYQIEQAALPMNIKQSYKLSFEFTEESSGKTCSCKKDSCQCCAQLKVDKLHLNSQVCFKASFLPKEIGFQAEITFNGKSVFKKKVTAQNPPPICGTFKKSAQLCLVFKNLHISEKKLEGCAEVDVKMATVTVGKVSLGCFKIPPMEFDRRLEVLNQLAPALVQTLMKGFVGEEETVMPLNNAEEFLQRGSCQSGTDFYSCCIDFPIFHKTKSVCMKIVFLPNTLGVDLQVLFNGKVIFHQEVKVKDPPPICVKLPFEKSASVCLKLKNLQLHKDSVSGCLEVDAKIKSFTVKKFNLGCFKIPPKVESQDLIGIGVSEEYFL